MDKKKQVIVDALTGVTEKVWQKTEEYYKELIETREQLMNERDLIPGTTKKGMELDEMVAKMNTIINAIVPMRKRTT